MLKGAMHVHSTYSDGEFTLTELKAAFVSSGCAFACVSDHAEAFNIGQYEKYLDECLALSDRDFTFVPGLEVTCENGMHILAYGLPENIPSGNPEAVIGEINGRGAVSVIAHPKTSTFESIKGLGNLPSGVETWNTKYDGRYAPRPETFWLLQNLQARKPDIHAFCGLDLHWKHQFRQMFTWVHGDKSTPEVILENLKIGSFYSIKGVYMLPSDGAIPERDLARFGRAQYVSNRLRHFTRVIKHSADRIGIKAPSVVKSQLRRIF